MSDLGDLLGLPTAVPAARGRVRCRNPDCGRPVYTDLAVFGYGEDCAEARGLLVRRWRLARASQHGDDLFTTTTDPEAPMILTDEQRDALRLAVDVLRSAAGATVPQIMAGAEQHSAAADVIGSMLTHAEPYPTALAPAAVRAELAEPDLSTDVSYPESP